MATKVHGSHIGTSGGASVGAELTYDAPVSSNTEYTIYCKGGAGLTAKNHTSANITYKLGGTPVGNVTVPKKPTYTYDGYWQTSSSASHADGTSWVQHTGTIHFNRTHSAYTATVYASITTNSHTSTASYSFTVNARASYKVSYDANGGSNAPSSQTKWYAEELTLSTSIPTRERYRFVGWATSSTATEPSYASGEIYLNNSSVTLYAVWEMTRSITSGTSSAIRCDADGTANEEGLYGKVECAYSLFGVLDNTGSVSARYKTSSGDWVDITSITQTDHVKVASVERLDVNVVVGTFAISQDNSYTIEVTFTDSDDNVATVYQYISQAFFTMDFKAGGKEIAFGTTASDSDIPSNGLFKCAMDMNVTGSFPLSNIDEYIGEQPYLEYGADFNNITDVGVYRVNSLGGFANAPTWCGKDVTTLARGRLTVYYDGNSIDDNKTPNIVQNYEVAYSGYQFRRHKDSSGNWCSWFIDHDVRVSGSATFTKASGSGGTFTSASWYVRGSVVEVVFVAQPNGSVSSGGNIMTGTIKDIPKPVSGFMLTSYFGNNPIYVASGTTGSVTVRNAGADAMASGNSFTARGAYLTDGTML